MAAKTNIMSTELKHTPEPWKKFSSKPELTDSRIYRLGVKIDIPGTAFKQRIKTASSIGGNLIALAFGRTIEECEANAKLIAAAPDLLDALDELLENVPKQTENADWWESGLVKAVERAKVTIKKATE